METHFRREFQSTNFLVILSKKCAMWTRPNFAQLIGLVLILLTPIKALGENRQFILRCGIPETNLVFVEYSADLDLTVHSTLPVIDLREFDKQAVAGKLRNMIEEEYHTEIVIPVYYFSFKLISKIADALAFLNYESDDRKTMPVEYCSNLMEVRRLGGGEALEKGTQEKFKDPVGQASDSSLRKTDLAFVNCPGHSILSLDGSKKSKTPTHF